MQSANSGMTNRVLTDILTKEYGLEAPANSNKQAILDLLKEAGCPVTPDETSAPSNENDTDASDKKKEPRYVVNIFKQKGEKGDVLGSLNGKAFVLPRGKNIEISQGIYEILTKGAIRMVGEPLRDGGIEMYEQAAYPLTLVEVIN
jgi:hypothetical protein